MEKTTEERNEQQVRNELVIDDRLITLTCRRVLIGKSNPGISKGNNVLKETLYNLKEVSQDELLEKRASGKPGFVLKVKNRLFYTPLPKNLTFTSSANDQIHLCSQFGSECCHLSCKSDDDGGCRKVRERAIEFFKNPKHYERVLKYSKRIEKYAFITKGYETFNTSYNLFIVIECNNYDCVPTVIKKKNKKEAKVKKEVKNEEPKKRSFWDPYF